MIARNHHNGHQCHILDIGILQLWNDILDARPSLNRVNVNILVSKCIELRLNDSVVGIGDMGRTMCHEQKRIVLAHLRELTCYRLDELDHIIRLLLLSLPVHERRAAGHRLELVLILVEHSLHIGVFHARNDIERDECNA